MWNCRNGLGYIALLIVLLGGLITFSALLVYRITAVPSELVFGRHSTLCNDNNACTEDLLRSADQTCLHLYSSNYLACNTSCYSNVSLCNYGVCEGAPDACVGLCEDADDCPTLDFRDGTCINRTSTDAYCILGVCYYVAMFKQTQYGYEYGAPQFDCLELLNSTTSYVEDSCLEASYTPYMLVDDELNANLTFNSQCSYKFACAQFDASFDYEGSVVDDTFVGGVSGMVSRRLSRYNAYLHSRIQSKLSHAAADFSVQSACEFPNFDPDTS